MLNKFNILYNLIMEELTSAQKKKVDLYSAKRSKDLTFGPMFKEERTYFPLKKTELTVMETPKEILDILENTDGGYYCPDFHDKYVYSKNDKLKSKPVSLVKVLSKALKNDKEKFNELKKEFDQRLGTSQKENIECSICITHNPYDIAGMSTDREWTSCMELDVGDFKDTPLKQVQYGGMCAYLIKSDDKNIEKPLARIAIKRFIGDKGGFIFKPETKIYGRVDFANSLDFLGIVTNILETSNKQTSKFEGVYFRDDENSYSDTFYDLHVVDLDNVDWEHLTKEQKKRLSTDISLIKMVDKIDKYVDKIDVTAYIAAIKNDIPENAYGWTREKILNFIKRHKDKIDFTKLFFNYSGSFDKEIYDLFPDKINYSEITENLDNLPGALRDAHLDELNLSKLFLDEGSSYSINKIEPDYVINHVDWNFVSSNINPFSLYVKLEMIMRKFGKFLDWNKITKHFCKDGFPKNIRHEPGQNWYIPSYTWTNLNYSMIGKTFDFTNKNIFYVTDLLRTFKGKLNLSDLSKNKTLTPKMLTFIKSKLTNYINL